VTHLVDDLARLGVDRRIVLPRLHVGEHLERRPRELRSEDQRLQTGDDRVAAEDAHEPGHAGAGELAHAGVVRAHPQRGEVGDGLHEAAGEVVPRRPQLRDAELPRSQGVANAADLLAEAAFREARSDLLAVRQREHVDVQLPALARLEREVVAHEPVGGLAPLRKDHLRLDVEVRVLV
jgi:hypothetical protein